MKISLGPTGNSIVGDVLDVNKASLERAIKSYDPLLYLKWNPTKNNNYGVWELRRRPEKKCVSEVVKYSGVTYSVIDYKESPLVNHVWDIPTLDYRLLERLKAADTFALCNYEASQEHRLSKHISDMDETAFQVKYQQQEKAKKEMLYNLMQDKKVFKDLQEKILSGVNPAHLVRHWK